MAEKDKLLFDKYTCPYCGHKFECRSGTWKLIGDTWLNEVTCPSCGNHLKNKGKA